MDSQQDLVDERNCEDSLQNFTSTLIYYNLIYPEQVEGSNYSEPAEGNR